MDFSIIATTYAQQGLSGNVFQTYDPQTIVRYGIALTIFLASLLAVLYVVWGGMLLVVSGGDDGKVKGAINHIRYAALGIVILVLVIFIAPIFLNLFGLTAYGTYFQPGVIFDTIREISTNILGGNSGGIHSIEDTVISPHDDNFANL